jgi:hypothetical protein
MRWTWLLLLNAAFASPIETISSVPLTLGNQAQRKAQRRHADFLRKLQETEATDQSSLMRQFMTSFSHNMKKAILEDSRGDMDEGERMRQLDALHAEDEPSMAMPPARGDDDADRLSQGLEPRSWSHAQPAESPRALQDFAEDLQRELSGRERQVREPQMPSREGVERDVREPQMSDEVREPQMPSREVVGLLNGHRHHAHRAMPTARSATVASALIVLAPALFL